MEGIVFLLLPKIQVLFSVAGLSLGNYELMSLKVLIILKA